jgi:hypothetical protein
VVILGYFVYLGFFNQKKSKWPIMFGVKFFLSDIGWCYILLGYSVRNFQLRRGRAFFCGTGVDMG